MINSGMKKKVAATRKHITKSRPHKEDNTFLIIVGGGFVVVAMIFFFSGMLPFSVNLLDITQSQTTTQTLGASTKQTVNNVNVEDNTYTPQKVLIQKGSTVVWTNKSGVAVSAKAVDGSFDTGAIAPGESKSVVFNKGGIYPYQNGDDASAQGVVLVLQ